MKAVVSVIMPAYNAAQYINSAIESVKEQTFKDWELIVVNDGSTDQTSEILEKIRSTDLRIQIVNQKNGKQAKARNAALKIAQGKYIAFLDADDLWLPNKLEVQIATLNKYNCDLVYSNGLKWFEKTNEKIPYPTFIGYFEGKDLYPKLYIGNHIPILSVLYKRDWVEKIGLQDEGELVSGCEDYDYWIRMAAAGAEFVGIEENLFIYRVHEGGVSQNGLKMKVAESIVQFKNLDYNLIERSFVLPRLMEQIKPLVHKSAASGMINQSKALSYALWKLSSKAQYYILWIYISLFKFSFKPVFYFLLLKK